MTPEETAANILAKYNLNLNPGQFELLAYDISSAIKTAVDMAMAKAAYLEMEAK